jgi:hypothetical protein
MNGRALTLTFVASVLVAVPARADHTMVDPYALPDAPRALSLPALTHPGLEMTTTTAIGALSADGHNSPAMLERIGVEAALGRKRWYLGVTYEAGAAPPVGDAATGPSVVGGNIEAYLRTIWATRTGLAFGGGVGLIPPTTSFAQGSQGSEVALAAISLQPWDYAYFRTGVFTTRPFVDMRSVFGHYAVQFRQSFDLSIDVHNVNQRDVSAATTFYFGWLATPIIGLGLEATEYYLIDAQIPDSQRAKVVFAPNIRFLIPGIEPAIGAFAGVGTPLASAADTIWGMRFALTFVWEPSQRFFRTLRLISDE